MTSVNEDTDGKIYTYTFLNIDPQLCDFKFGLSTSWAYEQTQTENSFHTMETGANNEVSVVCSGFKAIYAPIHVGDITVNIISVPAGTDSVYLVGSWNDEWQLSQAIATIKNTDRTFSAVIPQVANVEYKYWNRKDRAYEECQANGSSLASNRQFVFKDTPFVNIVIAG